LKSGRAWGERAEGTTKPVSRAREEKMTEKGQKGGKIGGCFHCSQTGSTVGKY